MEKVALNAEQREAFKGALREFIVLVDRCIETNGKKTMSYKSIQERIRQSVRDIRFDCKVSLGAGNLAGSGNGDGCPSVAFCPIDILGDGFVNGKSLSHTKGIYIWFGYYWQEEPPKIWLTLSGSSWNKENRECAAGKRIFGEDDRSSYRKSFELSKSSNMDSVLDSAIDYFVELVEIFNSIPQDDFRIRTNDKLEQKESVMKKYNQILYGPPGTGKTYHTINKALEILGFAKANSKSNNAILDYEKIKEKLRKLDIEMSDKERECAKALFDYYRAEGQIEFVTFHQNYGYEEFVEGIKPVLDSENSQNSKSSDVGYTIESGIFKEICERARENYDNSQKVEAVIEQEIDLNELLESYANDIQEQLNEGETPPYGSGDFNTKMRIRQVNRLKNGSFRSIRISVDGSNFNIYLYKDAIMRDYGDFKNGKIKSWHDIKTTIKGQSHRHSSARYYFALYDAIKNFEDNHYKKETTESSEIDNALKPYILIIDEINRGNISKILGELITLLEPSKRKGEKEWLELTLPYSKESFSVPNNLYIIGTMNTADRSIALLDMALRRRFDFIEMMPDSEKLSEDCEGINLRELLEAMNNRIEFLLSREQTIGHAFLIDVKNIEDLKAVFQNKIIPLLQEYFYNDYARIAAVLNGNGMVVKKEKMEFSTLFKGEFSDLDSEKIVYEITESSKWNLDTFKKIYE